MELGMVGLGRMGANMAERLVRGGHQVVGFSRSQGTVDAARAKGVRGTTALPDLVGALRAPRVVWLMVPAGAPTQATLDALVPLLSPGDLVVDGGNSYYQDTVRRAQEVASHGLRFVDVGTSGGIWGLTEGYSLMVGGADDDVARVRPALETLAPARDAGWGHVGAVGSGHFVKMVHNGIEYGLMQAYAEGFAILKAKTDYGVDLAQVAEIWRRGSVVRSWLLDLAADALHHPEELARIAPYVADSGEGRWTVVEAIDLGVPAPVITLSLEQRIRSREVDPFTEKLLASLRQKFGGHAVKDE